MKSKTKYGDHLISPRIGYSHHGLYIGSDRVIHYQGPFSGHDSNQIVISSLEQFCQGKSFTIKRHPHRRLSCDKSIERAYRRLGESRYNLLFNNCEHFVLWCIEDEHSSPQVTRAAVTVAASHLARISVGKTTSVTAAGVTGTTLSSSIGTSAIASLATVSTAPTWVPLAAGAAAAYGAHKLWQWLTD